MYFKFIKSQDKTKERVFLEEHPLVLFINSPITQVPITNGESIRLLTVDTKMCKIDIVERLKRETNIRNRMFVIYQPNHSDVYWGGAYNPITFEQSTYLRMAEIEIHPSEWDFMMRDELKKREERYLGVLHQQEKETNGYKFLLLRR